MPHDKRWRTSITNANDGVRTLMCVALFFVAPDHDAAKVRASLRDVALTSAYFDYQQSILMMLKETPWRTHYQLKAYQFDFISDLTIRCKSAIAESGARKVQPWPSPEVGTSRVDCPQSRGRGREKPAFASASSTHIVGRLRLDRGLGIDLGLPARRRRACGRRRPSLALLGTITVARFGLIVDQVHLRVVRQVDLRLIECQLHGPDDGSADMNDVGLSAVGPC